MTNTICHLQVMVVVMAKNSPFYNQEGYPDPTAYEGTKDIIRAEAKIEKKCSFLIDIIKFIIRESGFELLNRIELKHTESGRVFK